MSAPPTVSTPCIRICAVSARHGLCIGCGRTLKEIGGWGALSEAERLEIMRALPGRLEAAQDGG
ncbi:MAG: DUF1289 domain-containing protein [Alphaproteobacteria bacterium]|nr:DUF1289 domain-containing protein [Alphaproteobacteria bacterium]